MRWLWFVGSLVCFAVLFRTTSVALALLCLVGALAFMLIGALAVAAQRIERNRGDDGRLFGPEEIRQMREAEARRKAAAQGNDAADAAIVGVATASALIAAESTGRDAASPAGATTDDPFAADTSGGHQGEEPQ